MSNEPEASNRGEITFKRMYQVYHYGYDNHCKSLTPYETTNGKFDTIHNSKEWKTTDSNSKRKTKNFKQLQRLHHQN